MFVVGTGSVDAAAPVCFPAAPTPGPGVANPFRPPDPKARVLNADAKTLYRRGQWDQARKLYGDALAADPAFLAPRLNIACSFVRQERFAEAAAEAARLLDAAYVPWAREISEAADMGALKVRPEMAIVRAALAKSAQRWSAGLSDDLIFVARLRPPLRIPSTDAGVFVLGPHQEIFAWSPSTNRYRQLTADDGRVLGMLVSLDRRHVLYFTAEKLVRSGARDDAGALRGMALRRMDLTTMASAEPLRVTGDVARIEAQATAAGAFSLHITGDRSSGNFIVRADGGALLAGPPLRPNARGRPQSSDTLVLTADGVGSTSQVSLAGVCPLRARDGRRAGAPPSVQIEISPQKMITLPVSAGAGVGGLPLR
jgi:hypothetical protein